MEAMIEDTLELYENVVSDYKREAQNLDDYTESLGSREEAESESFIQRWDSLRAMMDEVGKRNALRAGQQLLFTVGKPRAPIMDRARFS